MGCVGSKQLKNKYHDQQLKKLNKVVNDKQLHLLRMIYQDLALRISENQLSLQNFLLFFHKNGYWGDRLFEQFDANASNYICQEQFIKGMVKIFKTTDQQKIQLLYKFFSNNKIVEGISFTSFLTMLYNYPKQNFQEILNDPEFINQELKKNLIGIDTNVQNRRLASVCPNDMLSKNVAGAAFRFQDNSDGNSDRLESKAGTSILNQMNQVRSNKNIFCLKLNVGQNSIQVKTTSLHHLVKKFARTIFKKYQISQKNGKLGFQQFRDWIKNHPNLFQNYYNGFHKEAWEIDRNTNKPLYLTGGEDHKSKAKLQIQQNKLKKVTVILINSVLIFCEDSDLQNPILIVCLEGLIVKSSFQKNNGFCVQISHRDDIYPIRRFYLINKDLQDQWMEYLKYFQGNSINTLYEMGEKIGMGKFSVVYSCKQKDTNQQYALKVIETFKLDDEARKLIAHQSSIMSILSHPLLVYFKDSIQTKTHIYIITELVKGKDMFQFVKDFKYLDQNEAAHIIQQIIIGVKYIHSLGIVHRDMKPQNVMIQFNQQTNQMGTVKIIDFGFANYISKLRQMAPEDLFAGTPNYIAPQILRGQKISQKIDNFAIGSIMYFAISGTLPFNSMEIGTILQKTLQGSFSTNGGRWKQISKDCVQLLQKLLQNDPQQRISLDDALKHRWFDRARNSSSMKTHLMGNRRVTKNNQKRIF